MKRKIGRVSFTRYSQAVLAEKKLTNCPHSYVNIEHVITKRLTPFFGKYQVTKINENIINAYIAREMGRHRLDKDIKYLKYVLRYALNEGAIRRIPVIRNPDPEVEIGKYVNPNDLNKLLGGCTHDEDLTLQIWMAYSMGMRMGEICHLRTAFVDKDLGEIRLPPWYLKTRRTVNRIIPVSDVVQNLLVKRSPQGVYLFPSPMIFGASIVDNKNAWKRLKKRTGVQCRFHDLRHSFVTNCVMAGIHVLTIRQVAGVSPQVMKRYSHVPSAEIKEAMDRALSEAIAKAIKKAA